jgi:hypothetical protein
VVEAVVAVEAQLVPVRNNEQVVQSARERYLARKRKAGA